MKHDLQCSINIPKLKYQKHALSVFIVSQMKTRIQVCILVLAAHLTILAVRLLGKLVCNTTINCMIM